MANDEERLLLTIEARTALLERQMKNASRITGREFKGMETQAKSASDKMASAFKGVGSVFAGVFAGVGIKEAQVLLDTSTRITNALKVAGLSGKELKSVYDSLFQSAQKNAAPLESLVTLYGRASLVQKELKVSQADLINFVDKVSLALRVAGTDSQTASGALLQLSQALGSGTVRAEEFNSVQEGALPILQAVAAGFKEAGGSVSKLRQLVLEGKVSSEGFFKAFEAGAPILEEKVAGAQLTVSQGFTRLGNVMINVAREFDNNTDAASLTAKFLGELGDIIQNLGGWIAAATGPLSDFAKYLDSVSASAQAVGANLGKMLGTDKIGPMLGLPAPKPSDKQIQDRINTAFGTGDKPSASLDITGGKPLRNPVKPISVEDYKPVAKDKKEKASGAVKKTADDRIAEDIQRTKDRTAALADETAMIGKAYEAQETRKMALDLEQSALRDLREEARKKGQTDLDAIKLSPEVVGRINAASEAYGRQAEELRKVEEAHGNAEQAANEFYDAFKSGMIGAITGAESLKDALSGVLKKLADMLLNSAFDALFKPASGNSPGGSRGNIFTGIGKILGFADGGYTGGGGVGDVAGVVHGKEFVVNAQATARNRGLLEAINSGVPGYQSGGFVSPAMPSIAPLQAPVMPRLQAPENSNSINAPVSISIDARGADSEGLARVQGQLNQLRAELPAHIVTTVRKAQKDRVL